MFYCFWRGEASSLCWFLVLAWTCPCRFWERFVIAFFLVLRKNDWPRIFQLALCLMQDKNIDFLLNVFNHYTKIPLPLPQYLITTGWRSYNSSLPTINKILDWVSLLGNWVLPCSLFDNNYKNGLILPSSGIFKKNTFQSTLYYFYVVSHLRMLSYKCCPLQRTLLCV